MYANVRGTRIYFDVDGMGLVPDGPQMLERSPIFLLHGGPGGDHSSFKSQVTANLRDVAQLIYVDHRGSGRSEPADPETYTLDNNIDDLDALREHLGFERITILGSSYGGMVAQGYAIRYPERVDRLILVSTAPSFRFMDEAKQILNDRGSEDQKRVCQRLWDATFENVEQLHEYYAAMGPMYATTFDPAKAADGVARGIRNFEQLNLGFGGFLRTFDYIPELRTINCPTLVLTGMHDWICPPNQSETIADQIPNAQLVRFEHSSHSIAQDEPEKFVETVVEFLTDQQ